MEPLLKETLFRRRGASLHMKQFKLMEDQSDTRYLVGQRQRQRECNRGDANRCLERAGNETEKHVHWPLRMVFGTHRVLEGTRCGLVERGVSLRWSNLRFAGRFVKARRFVEKSLSLCKHLMRW